MLKTISAVVARVKESLKIIIVCDAAIKCKA